MDSERQDILADRNQLNMLIPRIDNLMMTRMYMKTEQGIMLHRKIRIILDSVRKEIKSSIDDL